MAFQLFNVNSNFGNNLQQGIESIGQGINKAAELGEQYKTDSKSLDMLAKNHPELFPGYDEHGLSAVQKSQMFRGYIQAAQAGTELMKQQQLMAETAAAQARANAMNQSTAITAEEWERQRGGVPSAKTELGQQLMQQGHETSALRQDISSLGLDSDYEDFKKAYITANKYSSRTQAGLQKKAQNDAFWNAPGNNIPGTIGKIGEGVVGAVTGIASGYTPKSAFPEMTEEEKAAIVKLHSVTNNPAKAQAYMQLMKSEQSGVPTVAMPSGSGLQVQSVTAGPRGATTKLVAPKAK